MLYPLLLTVMYLALSLYMIERLVCLNQTQTLIQEHYVYWIGSVSVIKM